MKTIEYVCGVCGKGGKVEILDDNPQLGHRLIAGDHEKVSPSCDSRKFKITKGLPTGRRAKTVRAIHHRMVLEGGIIPK